MPDLGSWPCSIYVPCKLCLQPLAVLCHCLCLALHCHFPFLQLYVGLLQSAQFLLDLFKYEPILSPEAL